MFLGAGLRSAQPPPDGMIASAGARLLLPGATDDPATTPPLSSVITVATMITI